MDELAIVTDILRQDGREQLAPRDDGDGFAGVVGDDEPAEAELGDDLGGFGGRGLPANHRNLFGELLRMHGISLPGGGTQCPVTTWPR